jgi:hypothetical protein
VKQVVLLKIADYLSVGLHILMAWVIFMMGSAYGSTLSGIGI